MRKHYSQILLLFAFAYWSSYVDSNAFAQIVSHGVSPIGLQQGIRSVVSLPTLSINDFDKDSAFMAIERTNSEAKRLRGYVFAHKVPVHANIISGGNHFIIKDREVWQYRVQSNGATSLNFRFGDFDLPEGSFLSIYSVQEEAVCIGPWGADNNSSLHSLSTIPIPADDVVIEVQAPRGVTPRVSLEEVNVGLMNLFDHYNKYVFDCAPDAVCMPEMDQLRRSVVVIITDGNLLGSGVLVNCGKGNGTPYVLTASHVMNWNFRFSDYERRANNSVAIFNYTSPVCGKGVVPSMEHSISGATVVGVDTYTDLALIKFESQPPAWYNVFYAGWNATDVHHDPYKNLHYPQGQPMKYNQFDGVLSYESFAKGQYPFGENQFHKVAGWSVGTTNPASSGSPLMDSDNLVIGTLTGGDSECGNGMPDYFSSLAKLWTRVSSSENAKMMVDALTGGNASLTKLVGIESGGDMQSTETRVSHMRFSDNGGESVLEKITQAPSSLLRSFSEIGERYDLNPGSVVYGVYLLFAVDPEVSASNPQNPMRLKVYEAESGGEVRTTNVPIDRLLPARDIPTIREVYVPFDEPISYESVTPLLFMVNMDGIPDNTILASQTESVETSTAFARGVDGIHPLSPAATMWIDLQVKDSSLRTGNNPFVKFIPTDERHILMAFDPDLSDKSGQLDVYTIIGQPVARYPIKNGILSIEKEELAGLGVLLFHVTLGGRDESFKILIQKI